MDNNEKSIHFLLMTHLVHTFSVLLYLNFFKFFFENCFSQCFLDSFTRLLYHLCCEAREIPARFWQGTRQKVIESIVARMAVSPESAQRLCDVEMHEVYCTINKLWQRKISNSGEIFVIFEAPAMWIFRLNCVKVCVSMCQPWWSRILLRRNHSWNCFENVQYRHATIPKNLFRKL